MAAISTDLMTRDLFQMDEVSRTAGRCMHNTLNMQLTPHAMCAFRAF